MPTCERDVVGDLEKKRFNNIASSGKFADTSGQDRRIASAALVKPPVRLARVVCSAAFIPSFVPAFYF